MNVLTKYPAKSVGKTLFLLICATLAALLSACATTKPPQPVAAPPQVLATPQQVTAEPAGKLGRTVRWGGRVIGVNVEQEATVIEILALPLDSEGRPKESDSQGGRFLARNPGFLEPEVYRPGREITVSGTLTTIVTQPVGKQSYSYPVVEVSGLHLWPEREERPVYIYDSWGSWGPYYRPYYGPRFGIGVGGGWD